MENTFLTNERCAKLHEVEAYIEYSFKDISNLDKALTHSSYRNHPDYVTAYRNINECLEFLGDSVLDFVIRFFVSRKSKCKKDSESTFFVKYPDILE